MSAPQALKQFFQSPAGQALIKRVAEKRPAPVSESVRQQHAEATRQRIVAARAQRQPGEMLTPIAMRRREAETRPCMCCRKSFLSQGPHHRLCNDCRHKPTSPFDI